MGYNTINFKSKEILYAHQLNAMDQQISTNDNKVLYLDSEIKKIAAQLLSIPSWAKQEQKPTYTASEVGAYSIEEIDSKLLELTGVDLSNYYTKSEVDARIPTDYVTSDLLNNYALVSTLSDYVTLDALEASNYITNYTLESKDYASKTYVKDYVNSVAFDGIDLSEYLTIDDAFPLVNSILVDYVSLKYLQENYYTKEEIDGLTLGGSIQEEVAAREQGDKNLQEQIDGLTIITINDGYQLVNFKEEPIGDLIIVPKEKNYISGITLVDNDVQLSLADDELTKASLKINDQGALQFIGQQEEFLDIVGNYTINGHRICENPTLGGLDIRLKDYEGALITSDDTINDAFLKMEDILTWGTI